MSGRTVRLVLVPAILFVVVSATVFTLAVLHPAKPSASASAGPTAPGNAAAGEALFAANCASCHGQGGENGTVGPDLAGNPISIEDAQAQIENGGGVMPPNLVTGQDLADVLAYLRTIVG